MQNKTQQLQPGTLLQNGKYKIIKVLGQGGFGITYEAEQTMLKVRYAIKEFFVNTKDVYCRRDTTQNNKVTPHFDTEMYEKLREDFIKEARTLFRLDNIPNVVKVRDTFEENGTVYIVMENNILHRDIKPDNILINANDTAVLIDFGIARDFVDDKTQFHTAMLSPGYAPPEQEVAVARKGTYSDVYSVGATMYYCLTGKKPQTLSELNFQDYISAQSLNPHVSDEFDTIINKAIEKKSKDRFQSCGEFIEQINKCVGRKVAKSLKQNKAYEQIQPNNFNSKKEKTTPITPKPPIPRVYNEPVEVIDEQTKPDNGESITEKKKKKSGKKQFSLVSMMLYLPTLFAYAIGLLLLWFVTVEQVYNKADGEVFKEYDKTTKNKLQTKILPNLINLKNNNFTFRFQDSIIARYPKIEGQDKKYRDKYFVWNLNKQWGDNLKTHSVFPGKDFVYTLTWIFGKNDKETVMLLIHKFNAELQLLWKNTIQTSFDKILGRNIIYNDQNNLIILLNDNKSQFGFLPQDNDCRVLVLDDKTGRVQIDKLFDYNGDDYLHKAVIENGIYELYGSTSSYYFSFNHVKKWLIKINKEGKIVN